MAYDPVQPVSSLNKEHVSPADGKKSSQENHTSTGAFSNRKHDAKTLLKFNEYKVLWYNHYDLPLNGPHEVTAIKCSNKNDVVH